MYFCWSLFLFYLLAQQPAFLRGGLSICIAKYLLQYIRSTLFTSLRSAIPKSFIIRTDDEQRNDVGLLNLWCVLYFFKYSIIPKPFVQKNDENVPFLCHVMNCALVTLLCIILVYLSKDNFYLSQYLLRWFLFWLIDKSKIGISYSYQRVAGSGLRYLYSILTIVCSRLS